MPEHSNLLTRHGPCRRVTAVEWTLEKARRVLRAWGGGRVLGAKMASPFVSVGVFKYPGARQQDALGPAHSEGADREGKAPSGLGDRQQGPRAPASEQPDGLSLPTMSQVLLEVAVGWPARPLLLASQRACLRDPIYCAHAADTLMSPFPGAHVCLSARVCTPHSPPARLRACGTRWSGDRHSWQMLDAVCKRRCIIELHKPLAQSMRASPASSSPTSPLRVGTLPPNFIAQDVIESAPSAVRPMPAAPGGNQTGSRQRQDGEDGLGRDDGGFAEVSLPGAEDCEASMPGR